MGFRTRGAAPTAAEDVDFEALTEIIARVRRLSRRVLVATFALALAGGVGLVALALDGYNGPSGKALGARLGVAFCVGAALPIVAGVGVRRLWLRAAVPRWIDELAARGVDRAPLVDAIAPFV